MKGNSMKVNMNKSKYSNKKSICRFIYSLIFVCLLLMLLPLIKTDIKVYAADTSATKRFIKFTENINLSKSKQVDMVYYMIEVEKPQGSDRWIVKSVMNNICQPQAEDLKNKLGNGLFYTLHRAYLKATVGSVPGKDETYGWIDAFQDDMKQYDVDFAYVSKALAKLMMYAMYNDSQDSRIINILMKKDESLWKNIVHSIKQLPSNIILGPFAGVSGGSVDAIVDKAAMESNEITEAEAIIISKTVDIDGKITPQWNTNEGNPYIYYILNPEEVEATTKNPLGTSKLDKENGILKDILDSVLSKKYLIISNADWLQIENRNNGKLQRKKFFDYFTDEELANILIKIHDNNLAEDIEGFEVVSAEDIIKDPTGNAYKDDGTMSVLTNGMWTRVTKSNDGKEVLLKVYQNQEDKGNVEIASFKVGTYNGTGFDEEVYINEMTRKKDLLISTIEKKLASNKDNAPNHLLMYKVEGNKTIDDYNDIILILNTSSSAIDVLERYDGDSYKVIGSVSRDKITKGVGKSSIIKIETKEYYLYPSQGNLKVQVKTESGVIGATKTIAANKIMKIHAKDDMDGDNYIYFAYSNLIDADKDNYLAYYYVNSNESKTGADYDDDESEISSRIYKDLLDPYRDIRLTIGKYKDDHFKGYGKKLELKFPEKLADNKLSNYLRADYKEFENIPVTAALKLIDGVNVSIANAASIDSNLNAGFVYKDIEKEEYKNWIFATAKPIIMFLVFISILVSSLMAIYANQNPEERVKIKQRFGHVITGIIIFISASIILSFVINFTQSSFSEIEQISADFSGPSYEVQTNNSFGGIVLWIISEILDFFTWVADWLIRWVQETSSGEKANLLKLVFDTYEGGKVSTLKPFNDHEWATYMIGYRGLIGIAMAFLSIAIIKIAYGLVLHAGDAQKISEEKRTLGRIMISLIAIVLVPYAVRIILTLFNYLVAMLPVDYENGSFELEFDGLGIIGSIANAMFIWVKLKIYILFLVRKVMITVMLIASPFVLSIWAISGKFRSANLWLGEMLSNIATQFCYALVFFVVVLITYEGQNAFVTLLIVMAIPKFAKFFRDSLQGYVQRWGGINEEGIASDIVGRVKKYGQKARRNVNKVGRGATNVSNVIDSNGTKTSGRILHNVGAVLQEKPFDKGAGIRTRFDQRKNVKKDAIRVATERQNYLEAKTKELSAERLQNKDLDEKVRNIESGADSLSNYVDDTSLDTYRDYLEAKQEAQDAHYRKQEAIAEEKDYLKLGIDDHGKIKTGGPNTSKLDYISSPKRAAEKQEDRVVEDIMNNFNGVDKKDRKNRMSELQQAEYRLFPSQRERLEEYATHTPNELEQIYREREEQSIEDAQESGESANTATSSSNGSSSSNSNTSGNNTNSNDGNKNDSSRNTSENESQRNRNSSSEQGPRVNATEEKVRRIANQFENSKKEKMNKEDQNKLLEELQKAMIQNMIVTGEVNINLISDVDNEKNKEENDKWNN